jgi:hypothetical protein
VALGTFRPVFAKNQRLELVLTFFADVLKNRHVRSPPPLGLFLFKMMVWGRRKPGNHFGLAVCFAAGTGKRWQISSSRAV